MGPHDKSFKKLNRERERHEWMSVAVVLCAFKCDKTDEKLHEWCWNHQVLAFNVVCFPSINIPSLPLITSLECNYKIIIIIIIVVHLSMNIPTYHFQKHYENERRRWINLALKLPLITFISILYVQLPIIGRLIFKRKSWIRRISGSTECY